ncbi:daunorubicin resistance protein DrrA family ABC transporter ATP-binding protein [Polycladomyces abyssicola]|uniref:Daunorubicin resistance protein DrrA family ABC transporter ATP-binding protein n=1 Tax=Polycladomyces abyssicola TaxID=1125966 RepID=A0A8D5UBT9_9BACL|nr:ABC transporter ATP-binding protein [Polycladomyces abyssicola]BCU80352.1 daunorubicin resistance protein DrrA family ABC transporter ATP-binding protein [Polycladomyces abyssicola]
MTQAVSTPEHSTHRQSEDDVAIHCQHVNKEFVETVEGSRRWSNWFRGERRVVKAVDDVSFKVQRGEIFGLLGPNGSGKSTLIRLLSTLLFPDSGTVTIFGKDVVRHQHEVRRWINRVSVEASFFKKLSAMENLRYAARLYGLPVDEGEKRAMEILRRLGIRKNKVHTPLENLSRGMQQKVAIARALMTSPVLILLDEPTTGLDPKSKRDVQRYIKEVMQTHDATIFLTTHDMEEAESLCDRIAIIDQGRIVALDTPDGLKRLVGADSMETVFFELTGKDWEEALADEDMDA